MAYRYDGLTDKAAKWATKAEGEAATLKSWLGEEEGALAVAHAEREAGEAFERDLAEAPMNEEQLRTGEHSRPICRWRGRRGIEPIFR